VIVECIKFIDQHTVADVRTDSWLTLGKNYHVLTLSVSDAGSIEYRLISDNNNTPALFPAVQFKIIEPTLPRTWVVERIGESYLELAPQSWLDEGFWERFFDGDPSAVAIYEREKCKILALDTQQQKDSDNTK